MSWYFACMPEWAGVPCEWQPWSPLWILTALCAVVTLGLVITSMALYKAQKQIKEMKGKK